MRDDTTQPFTAFNDVKAMVGSIFFLWADLERALAEAVLVISRDNGAPAWRPFAQNLDRWRVQMMPRLDRDSLTVLDEILRRIALTQDLRNRLAHGLTGFCTHDRNGRPEPGLETNLAGESRFHPLQDCDDLCRVLCHLPSAVGSLTSGAMSGDPAGLTRVCLGIRQSLLP
jgi:hypothetical protein